MKSTISIIAASAVFSISACICAAPPSLCAAPTGTTVINGRGNNVAGRDLTVYQGASAKRLSSIDKRLANLEKIALQQNVAEARSNPAFQKIVQNIYGKSFDALSEGELITLWDNVLKALARAAEAEKNFEVVKQGAVGAELKALIPKIEAARNDFNYDEVNRLLSEFREKHNNLRQDLAKVDYLQGQNYELQINYPEAERYYKKAAAIEDENSLYLDAHATILWKMGRYDEAEPLYRRALAIGEKTLGPNHPDVATRLNNLALLLSAQGKYAEAEPLYRRALAIGEKTLGPNHPDVATRLNNLAGLLQDQGNYNDAEPLYRRAIEIQEKTLGINHPDVASSLNNLATLLHAHDNYYDAEPLYRRALTINEKVLGPNHPDVASNLNNLAELLRAQGKFHDAEPLYRRALAILEKSLGPKHPTTITIRDNLNDLLAKKKQ